MDFEAADGLLRRRRRPDKQALRDTRFRRAPTNSNPIVPDSRMQGEEGAGGGGKSVDKTASRVRPRTHHPPLALIPRQRVPLLRRSSAGVIRRHRSFRKGDTLLPTGFERRNACTGSALLLRSSGTHRLEAQASLASLVLEELAQALGENEENQNDYGESEGDYAQDSNWDDERCQAFTKNVTGRKNPA